MCVSTNVKAILSFMHIYFSIKNDMKCVIGHMLEPLGVRKILEYI